jgi:hypothetical protein
MYHLSAFLGGIEKPIGLGCPSPPLLPRLITEQFDDTPGFIVFFRRIKRSS